MFAAGWQRWLFAGMVAWLGFWVFTAYWAPTACDGVSTPSAHDFIKHHAVMYSLGRHALPLHNIFYAPEADTAYYYYGYHYLVPAAIRTLCGGAPSIRLVFGLSSALLAVGFVAVVYLLALDATGSYAGGLLAAACAGLVGGWDIVPVLLRVAGGAPMVITLDAWAEIPWRAHNLATQFLWCPQHVTALAAITMACLWLRRAPSAWWWILLAPLIGASILGSSLYLAMSSFLAAAVYVFVRLARAASEGIRPLRMLAAIATICLLGLVLMGPQAGRYARMGARHDAVLTLEWPRFEYALLGRLLPPGPLANLLDVPWMVVVDVGLGAVAALLIPAARWRAFWRDSGMCLLTLCGSIGLLGMYTVRSGIGSIDYGPRVCIMATMVLAAVCAGCLLAHDAARRVGRRTLRTVIAAGVFLGLTVGLYELPMMTVRHVLDMQRGQPRHWAGDAGAIRFLSRATPPDAIVQPAPRRRVALPQLINRQMGVLNPTNPHVQVFRPEDPGRAEQALADAETAFTTTSARQAYDLLRALGVTHVLLGEVEHRQYGSLDQFGDSVLFEVVYRDDQAAVMRLLEAPPGPEEQPEESRE